MNKTHSVTLTDNQRASLARQVAVSRGAARAHMHARFLLKADEGQAGPGWTDTAIASAFEVSTSTIERVRKRLVEHGLEDAIRHWPRREYPRKLDGEQEAHLVVLVCTPPPVGRRRWTLRLLADKMVELRYIDGVSYETVRQVLKKNALKAHVVKDLVDVRYPDADTIILVLDNLNTHTPAALYEAYPPAEVRRIVERLEIHYTPKHGSWLNVAESLQRIIVRRALEGHHPQSQDELIAWLDDTVAGWNAHPTPFTWHGKRYAPRQRARARRRGDSSATTEHPQSIAA